MTVQMVHSDGISKQN